MKWIGIGVGAVLALVALMALIGTLVAREHVASTSAVLHQPPDSVWKVISDLGGVPQWWSEIKSSERLPERDGKQVWRQRMSGWDMALVVEEATAPRRLVTRIDAPPDAAFGGTWIYEIAPADGGRASTVRITERGYIGNPIFRFLSRFVFGYYGTLEGYLKALGRRLGEDVTPVRAPTA